MSSSCSFNYQLTQHPIDVEQQRIRRDRGTLVNGSKCGPWGAVGGNNSYGIELLAGTADASSSAANASR